MYKLGGSINGASPKWLLHNGHPIKMDDLGYRGTLILGNFHMYIMYIYIYV